jgi:hypothetical protein
LIGLITKRRVAFYSHIAVDAADGRIVAEGFNEVKLTFLADSGECTT